MLVAHAFVTDMAICWLNGKNQGEVYDYTATSTTQVFVMFIRSPFLSVAPQKPCAALFGVKSSVRDESTTC